MEIRVSNLRTSFRTESNSGPEWRRSESRIFRSLNLSVKRLVFAGRFRGLKKRNHQVHAIDRKMERQNDPSFDPQTLRPDDLAFAKDCQWLTFMIRIGAPSEFRGAERLQRGSPFAPLSRFRGGKTPQTSASSTKTGPRLEPRAGIR